MCQTIILSRKGSAIISQCMDCKTLTIWQHNLLLYFTPAQFKSFKDFAANLDIYESLFHFPDGEERLMLHTPSKDICFSFTLEEWEDFNEAMEEAAYMQGIYKLIY